MGQLYKSLILIPALFACLLATACVNSTPKDPRIKIVSEPTNAFVDLEYEQQNCLTPCTLLLGKRTKIIVSKEGFVSQTFYLEPKPGRTVRVKLELTAASKNVETTELPEL